MTSFLACAALTGCVDSTRVMDLARLALSPDTRPARRLLDNPSRLSSVSSASDMLVNTEMKSSKNYVFVSKWQKDRTNSTLLAFETVADRARAQISYRCPPPLP